MFMAQNSFHNSMLTPSLLWEYFPGCPVGLHPPTAQFSKKKSNPYVHSTSVKVLPLLSKSKGKWATPSVINNIIPLLLVTMSKLELIKISGP